MSPKHTRSPHGHGARVLAVADHGLNETLAAAARTLKAEGARGMLVLPGDIPAVTAAEIAGVAGRPRRGPRRQPGRRP